MKKYIVSIFSLLLLISCSDDKYERMNVDPKNPSSVPAEYLFSSASKELMDQVTNLNVNTNIFRFVSQYLTSTTYTQEPNYNLTDRNIPGSHFTLLYRNVLIDLKDAEEFAIANDQLLEESEVNARLAQIHVLQVFTWQYLVDTFGNVPYTEALDTENTTPVYDDANAIYEDLINKLIDNNENFGGQGFPGGEDLIYDGNMDKWQKFSNSLLLRLGMRLTESNPELANLAVQTAVSNGLMTSNDDNAIFQYLNSTPNTNPLWEDLVQSGRNDFVAANTIVDYMNDLEDPRRTVYFDDNLEDGYNGGTYGASNSYSANTHIGAEFRDPAHPGILMDYTEVEFLLTEAAARGIAGVNDAESHYENAITASMQYWLGDDVDVDSYLDQDNVAYSDDNWEETVALQFWLAMYDNAFQGWYVWRKFDAPVLNIPSVTENPVPLRFTYPILEQNLNGASYNEAANAIGGDTQQTPLFWDVQ
ncbi:SusD/RagB family nutrient-binding outer membrane lipoprotein [Mesonia aestuariivivens]|uniref:SusD/RagB family nutrient-binding outer membrane lipoprotein n=1 Tax=Mesonia aestuariivivens TaxID=2796128 RepID=A0ABS6W0U1_9FLAO|nr:SusD/RagB family nutrient-binding outer membrane lipoprotein [Mesonia aestuariivivens]MBW2961478.1 SusD/RagB family nutrient-binding outer membrane lipoprotein [Mesonia aestuariivivens]